MNIVVDKLPCSCYHCMFMGYENLVRYCRITENVVEKIDELGNRLYDYRDDKCPLVEFETLLNNTIY